MISLENMNGELGGSFLCQLMTQGRLEIRPLGQTGNLIVESHATVLANGNNITVAGDLVRRSIQCSLDPEMERPELRQFRSDPFKTVVADRGKYVAAALTVVRGRLVGNIMKSSNRSRRSRTDRGWCVQP
jgi:putative DNA primase/helicase